MTDQRDHGGISMIQLLTNKLLVLYYFIIVPVGETLSDFGNNIIKF